MGTNREDGRSDIDALVQTGGGPGVAGAASYSADQWAVDYHISIGFDWGKLWGFKCGSSGSLGLAGQKIPTDPYDIGCARIKRIGIPHVGTCYNRGNWRDGIDIASGGAREKNLSDEGRLGMQEFALGSVAMSEAKWASSTMWG